MENRTAANDPAVEWSGKSKVVRNYDAWSLSLYKKQKRIVIETQDYHAGPLIITRDELCDIAKIMGLHVRKRKRKNKLNDEHLVK